MVYIRVSLEATTTAIAGSGGVAMMTKGYAIVRYYVNYNIRLSTFKSSFHPISKCIL